MSRSRLPLQIHSAPGDGHPCVLQRSHDRGREKQASPRALPASRRTSSAFRQPGTLHPAVPTATCVCNPQATPAAPVPPGDNIPLPPAQKGHWMQRQAHLQLHCAVPKPAVTADGKPCLSSSRCHWRRRRSTEKVTALQGQTSHCFTFPMIFRLAWHPIFLSCDGGCSWPVAAKQRGDPAPGQSQRGTLRPAQLQSGLR